MALALAVAGKDVKCPISFRAIVLRVVVPLPDSQWLGHFGKECGGTAVRVLGAPGCARPGDAGWPRPHAPEY